MSFKSLSEAYGNVLQKNIIQENIMQGVTDKLANAAKAIHGGIAPKPPQQQNNEETPDHRNRMISISNKLFELAQEIRNEYGSNDV